MMMTAPTVVMNPPKFSSQHQAVFFAANSNGVLRVDINTADMFDTVRKITATAERIVNSGQAFHTIMLVDNETWDRQVFFEAPNGCAATADGQLVAAWVGDNFGETWILP